MTSSIVIRAVPVEETRPLRRAVLRPQQHVSELVYPGDDDPQTRHFAAFAGDEMVGIASVYHQPQPGNDDQSAWRLRAMATVDHVRGEGIGGRLLNACIEYAIRNGANLVWCNARTSALWFYEHYGFAQNGDEFDIPGIGPHYVMIKSL